MILDEFMFFDNDIQFDGTEWNGEGSATIWAFDHCTVYESIDGKLIFDFDDNFMFILVTHTDNLKFCVNRIILGLEVFL